MSQKVGGLAVMRGFGNVITSVETMIRLKVHSTFIVKNNQTMYPMQALHAVLKARFGNHPAGHWVVFSATIAGVKLFALAYAWSQRGVSYFLSTCGETTPHEQKYLSHYEDDFGNVRVNEIDRPSVAHFLYEYLPLIDEHNKQRQNLLNLERCWCTKDPWFRLQTTVVGMCVVDMHRWVRNRRYNDTHLESSNTDAMEDYESGRQEMMIRQFSDKLCASLDSITRDRPPQRSSRNPTIPHANKLVRIMKDGCTTRPPTEKQLREGRQVGAAINANCLICRKYLSSDDSVVYKQTTFCCVSCRMPLCKENRADVTAGRFMSCVDEHLESQHKVVGCFGVHHPSTGFPKS